MPVTIALKRRYKPQYYHKPCRLIEAGEHSYQQQVLKNIGSALSNSAFRDQVFSGDDVNVRKLAPEGIITGGFLDQKAWNIAKSNNSLTKAEVDIISRFTYLYGQQQRVLTGFEELRKIYTERIGQEKENAEETLKLMGEMYRSYIASRTPDILRQ